MLCIAKFAWADKIAERWVKMCQKSRDGAEGIKELIKWHKKGDKKGSIVNYEYLVNGWTRIVIKTTWLYSDNTVFIDCFIDIEFIRLNIWWKELFRYRW